MLTWQLYISSVLPARGSLNHKPPLPTRKAPLALTTAIHRQFREFEEILQVCRYSCCLYGLSSLHIGIFNENDQKISFLIHNFASFCVRVIAISLLAIEFSYYPAISASNTRYSSQTVSLYR